MSGCEIFDVARLEGRLTPFRWDWAEREADWIEARWAQLLAERPHMFDGQVLMAHRWRREGETFRVAYFVTRFSRFLCWREAGRPAGVANCFSMAALRSADGAFLLGEMGAHTANAGKIYFPAGTPDLDDVAGDVVDLEAGALRELGEETGIEPGEVEVAPGWRIVAGGGQIACMKAMRFGLDAPAALARVHAALEGMADRELARMHAVRGPGDLDLSRTPPFIAAYLEDPGLLGRE